MTLIVAVSCPEGLAVSSDSCTAVEVPDATSPAGHVLVPFNDSAQKVTVVGNRFVVARGGCSRSGTPAVSLQTLRDHPAVQAACTLVSPGRVESQGVLEPLPPPPEWIDDVGRAFGRALIEAAGVSETSLLLAGWVNDEGVPRIFTTNRTEFQPCDLDPRTGRPGYTLAFAGYSDFVAQLIQGAAQTRFPFANFTLQQAADLSRWCIQTTMDMQGFEARQRFVDGPILTAVATRDGARMIRGRVLELRDFGLTCAALEGPDRADV